MKWYRGGVLGGLLPQETPLTVPCPPGGSGGLRPPGISVNYPCLASAAAVPCPRALPPIFFSSEFFRPNFFRPNFFRPMFFRPSLVRRPSSVVRKIFSAMYCLSNLFRTSIRCESNGTKMMLRGVLRCTLTHPKDRISQQE